MKSNNSKEVASCHPGGEEIELITPKEVANCHAVDGNWSSTACVTTRNRVRT